MSHYKMTSHLRSVVEFSEKNKGIIYDFQLKSMSGSPSSVLHKLKKNGFVVLKTVFKEKRAIKGDAGFIGVARYKIEIFLPKKKVHSGKLGLLDKVTIICLFIFVIFVAIEFAKSFLR